MTYRAPVKDMLFCMKELADLEAVARMPGLEESGIDTAAAVLEEAAKFNQDVVAPLNREGDKNPSSFKDGKVTTTPGFKQAFKQFGEGGWQGLQHPVSFGGQGLPKTIGAACIEMLNSANMSFALCPLLTDGAIEALLTAGSPEQQQQYIPKMVDGSWTGTMNLTEPQAGSDLALVRTRAEPQGDGSFKLFGTKIFITYGEHDMADNIVHMVLARVVGAPEGVKGISLFICPKVLPDGKRNDVHCVSIEHKLGIKASPTAVLQYGDHGGAIAHLIGQENRGLEYMFIMMNAARYAVGVQGIAIAERAYQKAVAYARDRVQSRPVDGSMNKSAPIIHHPDIKRMLMTMRAYTEGCRAMSIVAAAAFDAAHHHADAEVRKHNNAFYEFMVPLVKGFSTEMSLDVASLGVQVHGGMGFIEETGAAQYLRDAKILTIYEGTTAIQANDLVGRKTARDGGQVAKAIAGQIERTEAALATRNSAASKAMHKHLFAARKAFVEVVDFVATQTKGSPNAVFAGSVPYLMLAGNLMAGWQMARALIVAEDSNERRGVHGGQGRHVALLRRAHPLEGAGHPRLDRRRPRGDQRHGAGGVLMTLPAVLSKLRIPVVGAPLFIISNPKLVIAQCTSGVVGSMPALNARPASQLDEWLAEITETLAAWDRKHPEQPAAPYAINQIVHKSNDRLDHDMQVCAKYKVPVVITSLGARTDVNDAVHAWGGIVLHDIINNFFAKKAVEKGADGLIAVAAGAGGHAGVKSPFALIQEIREWFDGPLALSGAISTGGGVLAAQAMGADLAYIGSAFIATEEARASEAYKQAIVDGTSDDIVYSSLFTGVHGNYLKPSIRNAGLDPDDLPESDPTKMNFGGGEGSKKAWKDIWGCGQGIGAVKAVVPAAALVDRLAREYGQAQSRLAA